MSATRFYKGLCVRERVYYDPNSKPVAPINEFVIRSVVIPLSYADGTTEFQTGFTFPATAVVVNAAVNVITAEATGTTKTLSVGTATADSGTPTLFLNGLNVASTGLKSSAACAPIAITPGVSPYAYTANGAQVVTVTGGTVSAITLTRGGVATASLGTAGIFSLGDGDVLTVTYTVVPTMKSFPDSYPANIYGCGGKHISWTPGSANWANFTGQLLIDYIVLGDVTPGNTSEVVGPSN